MNNNTITPSVFEKEISYKTINVNDFELGYNVESKEIVPDENGFISNETSNFFIEDSGRFNKSETVLLNFGVGQGKSTTFNRLVNRYIEEGYVAIILVPFKSLIEKYYEEFSNLGENRFNYRDFETHSPRELKLDSIVKKDLQVLSVNAFLRNPGDTYVMQSSIKQSYLDLLYLRCKKDNKKAVIFVDEIHASIHNFQRDKIFNLLNWKDRLHKVFLASATFTDSSIQLSKYFSLLTEMNVLILSAERSKIEDKRSDIYLYLSNQSYNSNNIGQHIDVERIIRKGLEDEEAINILSYSKNLAKAIRNNYSGDFKSYGRNLKLCTSETVYEFDENHNSHVGTNFSTGVNINGGIFIVLLPPHFMINGMGKYGIFTNGYIALIQSVARMRKKGKIYIFSSYPKVLIEGEYIEHLKELNFLRPFKKTPFNNFVSLTNKFKYFYFQNKEKHLNKISFIDSLKQIDKDMGIKGIPSNHIGIQLNYPTYEEFLLKYSDRFYNTTEYSAGKEIIPYLFWALFNDQIQNAKLKQIITDDEILELDSDNIEQKINECFENLLSTPFGYNTTSFNTKSGFYNIELLSNLLSRYNILYNGRNIGVDNLFIKANLMKFIGREIKGIDSYNDVHYFNDCIEASLNYSDNDKEIINVYKDFAELKQNFIDFMEGNKVEIKNDYYLPASLNDDVLLPTRLYSQAISVIAKINETDSFVRGKAFSLLRGQETPSQDKIYKKLCDLFVKLNKEKNKRKNSKRYYLFEGFIDVKGNYINFLYNEDLNPFYEMEQMYIDEFFVSENEEIPDYIDISNNDEPIVTELENIKEENKSKDINPNIIIDTPFGDVITPDDIDLS